MKSQLQYSIYEKLVNEEDARACKAIPDSACKVVPGNFIKIICAQFLTKLGDALINPKVTLPWIMHSIGAPLFLIGWLVPIREAGSLVPQLAIAHFIRRLPRRKWVWVTGSVLQAVCVMAIGLIAMNIEGASAGWLVIGVLTIFSLSRGLNSVAAKDVLGKTVPKNQRGRVNGWSSSAAGLVTIGLALLLAASEFWHWHKGQSFYATSLLLAGLVWLAAALIYGQIDEYRGEVDGGRNGMSQALKQLALIKTDKAFRRFLLTRTLFLSTALSAPYYLLLAQKNAGSSLWVLALFMFASGLASFVAGPFWGKMADRSSRSVMMLGASMCALVGIVLFLCDLWLADWQYYSLLIAGLYFLVCIAHDGVRVGRKTYLVDIAEGDKRTSYVAVSNTVIGVMLLVMSLFGLLTQWISLSALVLVFAFIVLLGVWMAKQLPDVNG
ncbi:Predicted arabinose efflux permease, MFS family [Vibrio xiamenensis]|uniref:Predicted arabinose efflux permease, MFS family n=1 Tax=Vibrio xiamenensis TaxID=861298 RepID=A0A1G8GJ18_9VIBR|nr:MFS transporter [Vibrio xiamenensis]SDH94321.1 Predicted arabinose efflux permease, MFS family [Vibrio xiamenensis]